MIMVGPELHHILDDDPRGFAKISGHVESDLALAMDDFFHPKKMGWSDFHPNLLAVFMFSIRWF